MLADVSQHAGEAWCGGAASTPAWSLAKFRRFLPWPDRFFRSCVYYRWAMCTHSSSTETARHSQPCCGRRPGRSQDGRGDRRTGAWLDLFRLRTLTSNVSHWRRPQLDSRPSTGSAGDHSTARDAAGPMLEGWDGASQDGRCPRGVMAFAGRTPDEMVKAFLALGSVDQLQRPLSPFNRPAETHAFVPAGSNSDRLSDRNDCPFLVPSRGGASATEPAFVGFVPSAWPVLREEFFAQVAATSTGQCGTPVWASSPSSRPNVYDVFIGLAGERSIIRRRQP